MSCAGSDDQTPVLPDLPKFNVRRVSRKGNRAGRRPGSAWQRVPKTEDEEAWNKKPLIDMRVINASKPRRTYVVGKTDMAEQKRRLVIDVYACRSSSDEQIANTTKQEIERKGLNKDQAIRLREEMLGPQ